VTDPRLHPASPTRAGDRPAFQECGGPLGPGRATDELSLAEEVQSDLARLASRSGERPSLGLSGEIRLQPGQRQQFLEGLRGALEDLFSRYGGSDGEPFRIAVACYPREDESA
jgi:hypothetical protein